MHVLSPNNLLYCMVDVEGIIELRMNTHQQASKLVDAARLSEEIRLRTLERAPRGVLFLELQIAITKSELENCHDADRCRILIHELEELQWLYNVIRNGSKSTSEPANELFVEK
jgi:hypothetical protein